MIYGYKCEKCEESWDETHLMEERDKPVETNCPHCLVKGEVIRLMEASFISYHGTKGALKRAGSGWNDVLKKIKSQSGRNNTIETY